MDIEATQDEKYHLVIQVAEGKLKKDQIKEWIENHLKE